MASPLVSTLKPLVDTLHQLRKCHRKKTPFSFSLSTKLKYSARKIFLLVFISLYTYAMSYLSYNDLANYYRCNIDMLIFF